MADATQRGRAFLLYAYRQAGLLGHTMELEERRSGLGWGYRCSCGKASTFRRTKSLALGALFHHAGAVVGEHQRNGGQPLPDTPKDAEMPPVKIAGL